MPKLKTHKGTRKRIQITGRRKLKQRTAGQNHFNSRESSRTTRNKRSDLSVAKSNQNAVKKLIPYI